MYSLPYQSIVLVHFVPAPESYHQHVGHQLETVRSPLQVHECGTVYRQPSAQHPNHSLPSIKDLNRLYFWTVILFVTTCTLTVFSALATVCTVLRCISRLTLHYIIRMIYKSLFTNALVDHTHTKTCKQKKKQTRSNKAYNNAMSAQCVV